VLFQLMAGKCPLRDPSIPHCLTPSCTQRPGRVVNTSASYREVAGSNLGLETDYSEVFRDFRQSHQTNAGIVPYIRPLPLPSRSFSLHHSLVIISFDVIYSVTEK
jgi:hypothetical protein